MALFNSCGMDIKDNFRLVTDTGVDRNADENSRIDPAYALFGAVYTIGKGIEAAMAVKWGLNMTAPEYGLTTGVTFHF